ncbi:coiled-coil domain-containing protein 173-like [Siniperca chuatsi]|uniref:coiled-coil domain-containing protein 173-like n=1 Tax=Siniperca chuatsi TaxID=119488 RepID=UPI001CE0894E|nr:coiled-coil domain-containing protein 173-like [Siniperca chuatsi]
MAPPEEAVLSRADWERIQSSLNQPEAKVYTRQHVIESNALNLIFRTEDKLLKTRCRKLQATKKLEQQAKEAHLNMLAAEEVELKKQDWQQAVDEANIKRFHQNDWVRKYNSALLTTYVQKENEAVMEFNREKQRTAEERTRQYEEEMRSRENKALRQEQDKARQRQLYNQAVADHHIEQMKANKQLREEERQQEKEERDRLRGLDELHAQELRHQAEIKAESKKSCLKYHLEAISSADLNREREAQKLKTEEEERKRVRLDIEGKQKQRKNDQAAKFRKHQILKEIVTDKLAVRMKEQAASTTLREEAKLSKEVAEQDAQVAKQQKDKEEKRAAMLRSISAYRETKIQEKKQKENAEQQSNLDWFQARKQSDRLFLEEEKQKAKRARENKIKCRVANVTLMAENRAILDRLKKEEQNAAEKNAEQIAEWDKQLQQYVQCELHEAADSRRNVTHLLAASTGVIFDGEEPVYYCKNADEKMPRFATDQTCFKKWDLERNKLQLVYKEAGKVDQKPTHPPPISNTIKLKSTDTLASKEKTGGRGPTVAVEGSHYLSKNTGDSFPRFATERSRSTKQYLKQNKLQLTYKENSRIDQQPTHLPPISTKEAPAGRRCPPARCGGFPLLF